MLIATHVIACKINIIIELRRSTLLSKIIIILGLLVIILTIEK